MAQNYSSGRLRVNFHIFQCYNLSMNLKSNLNTHSLFKLSMIWRTFYGTLKIIFGLILLRILSVGISNISLPLFSKELLEDPNDLFIKFIELFINKVTVGTGTFIAFYLIFWGLIDAFFSFYLLRKKLWAYPVTLWLIGSFTLYEIYRYFHTFSYTLLFVILIDIVIFILIHKEYRILKKVLS